MGAFEGTLPRRKAEPLGDHGHCLGDLVPLAAELVVLPLQIFELSAKPLGFLLGGAHPFVDMVSVTSSSGSTLNSCRVCSIHFVTRSRASAAPAESMWSLVKDISIQAQFLANCGGSGSRRAGRPRRAREPSAPALELLPHEGRAAGQGCELLVAHVARRPAA